MTSPTSSRLRMLAALQGQADGPIPCSFMLFKGLWSQSNSYLDFVQRQLDLGLDAFVQIPTRPPGLVSDSYNLYGLPVRHHPAVKTAEWKETLPGERWPVLFKEYTTPAGVLRAEINQDDEWPYGDHVPFLDDYVETRSRRFLVETLQDLEPLRYLLGALAPEDLAAFEADARSAKRFAQEKDLLVTGGWGVGADLVGWVYGLQKMIYASYDQPTLLSGLLEIIEQWNRERMQVVLRAGVDVYIKRAWYENCDFWSPKTWRKYIAPILTRDAELAHSYGARFGYLITSNCMPLLEMIAGCGVDVLIGVDPHTWDLAKIRAGVGSSVCLWGGVNGHLTIEQGAPEAVRAEVRTAVRDLSPGGGMILSPVDNVRELTPTSQRNIAELLDEWRSAGRV